MRRPSKVDVVGTLVSATVEISLVGWWVNRKWFRVKRRQRR